MSFLADMIERRAAHIESELKGLSSADLERLACAGRAPRGFASSLVVGTDVRIIAEVKKASPSRGPIAPDCEASKQALHYQHGGASAISVLTEPSSFGGSWDDLSDVADAVDIPVLCKDFVVDPRQLHLARGRGADAVLLMVSVLGAKVAEYLDLALTLNLDTLVEVHDDAELRIALMANAPVVGVNSRNLATLEVDPEAARSVLRSAYAAGCTVVAESGVSSRVGVEEAAAAGAHAVLIGEALMRSAYPEDLLGELTGVPRLQPS